MNSAMKGRVGTRIRIPAEGGYAIPSEYSAWGIHCLGTTVYTHRSLLPAAFAEISFEVRPASLSFHFFRYYRVAPVWIPCSWER